MRKYTKCTPTLTTEKDSWNILGVLTATPAPVTKTKSENNPVVHCHRVYLSKWFKSLRDRGFIPKVIFSDKNFVEIK